MGRGEGARGDVSGSRSLIIIGLWVVRGGRTWKAGKEMREEAETERERWIWPAVMTWWPAASVTWGV